jgi:hypothetical protein
VTPDRLKYEGQDCPDRARLYRTDPADRWEDDRTEPLEYRCDGCGGPATIDDHEFADGLCDACYCRREVEQCEAAMAALTRPEVTP